jgi:hypothetical protein
MSFLPRAVRPAVLPLSLSALFLVAAMSACCAAASAPSHKVGLGKVLTASDGVQIYGFDIDQNGNDGVLASAGYQGNNFVISVETFNEDTGKITKTFATKDSANKSYSVDAIFDGDVGLITEYYVPNGQIYATRSYDVMNPVTAKKFTGSWNPTLNDVDIQLVAENQATSTGVVYVIELKNQDQPDLIVSDIGANTVSNVIQLDPNYFSLANGPQLGQYTAANQAVIAESPDAGAVGGEAPENYVFDLSTGSYTNFAGYNNGPYHAGDVNGLATDPNTGVTATTTELNAQVEFYDMASETAITYDQLPCTNDTAQTFSGSGIAVDPVNQLFLVTELSDACNDGQSAAIVVYDESGNYVETISGFPYTTDVVSAPAAAINPSKRMGWVYGGPDGLDQLQQFYY